MMLTKTFEQAVREYLRPYEGAFNYERMVRDLLDTSRFEARVHEASEYKNVSGCTVFSRGCASAGDLLAFMRAGASRVYGIEIDQRLADLARLRFAGTEHASAFEMRVYDGGVLPYPDNSFDVVFSRAAPDAAVPVLPRTGCRGCLAL